MGAPVSMDKMLYLSERMFYQEGTTDEGYLDECARLRSQLGGMSQVLCNCISTRLVSRMCIAPEMPHVCAVNNRIRQTCCNCQV